MNKKNAMNPEVAIVGGGMVGLSLALMLAKSGLCSDVLVCDQQPASITSVGQEQASFDTRSTAISAGSARIFEELGLWSAIKTEAQGIQSVCVSDKGRYGSSCFSADENKGRPLGYVVENSWLGAKLKQAVDREPKIRLIAPTSVKAIHPKQGGMEFDLVYESAAETDISAEGKPIRRVNTSLLVLADGANSALAKSLGIVSSSHDYKQHALVVNVAHTEPHNGVAFEHFTESGPLAFLPLLPFDGKHRSAVVWTHGDQQIDHMLQCDDEMFKQKLETQFSHRLGSISQVGARAAYKLSLVSAEEQVRKNLVLAGNAAHFLHPVAGQGFNLALRDCAVFVNCLKEGAKAGGNVGDLKTLQAYSRERALDQWLTTELSHNFISLFASDNKIKRSVRTGGLTLLNQIPPAKSFFFKQMMGLGLNEVSLR